MKYQTIFGVKGAIYYVAIAKVIFSHVKIACYFHMHVKKSSFRAKAHLLFHWCLYNKFKMIILLEKKKKRTKPSVAIKQFTPYTCRVSLGECTCILIPVKGF